MPVMTPFGYEMASYPDIITQQEFNTMTGNRFSGNSAVPSAISAASQAVRGYCNWHITPRFSCTYRGTALGNQIWLPFAFIESVTSVKDGSTTLPSTDYEFMRQGKIRKKTGYFTEQWDGVEVVAVAGVSDDPLLKSIVAQIVANAISAPAGVREEHAGDVGITYNQTGTGVSGGVTLLARDKEMLAQYCLANAVM